MNIGIFETQHFEGAYPMIRILDIPGNNLYIFVNETTHKRFSDLFGEDMTRFTWIIQKKDSSPRQFIFQIFKTCKQHRLQLLFLNTVTAHFMLYGWMAAFLPSVKVIVTLHDANNFLRSRFVANIRQSVRHAGKKVLGHFCYAYSTVSETVKEHLEEVMHIKKPVFCIPGAVFERQNMPLASITPLAQLRIVVPGSVDYRRRNYEDVFELLHLVNTQALPVTIVLAGGFYKEYGKYMLEKCKDYASRYNNLIFFDTLVLDQSMFDAELDAAHLVWIPSVIDTVIADGIGETYGLTKSSGNIFDAIKHARPLLVPSALIVQPQLMSSVCKYDSIKAVTGFLERILQEPRLYTSLAQESFNNSMKYTAAEMRKRVSPLFPEKSAEQFTR